MCTSWHCYWTIAPLPLQSSGRAKLLGSDSIASLFTYSILRSLAALLQLQYFLWSLSKYLLYGNNVYKYYILIIFKWINFKAIFGSSKLNGKYREHTCVPVGAQPPSPPTLHDSGTFYNQTYTNTSVAQDHSLHQAWCCAFCGSDKCPVISFLPL